MLKFLRICLLFFVLVAIHDCQADDAEDEGEHDEEGDVMPPDEEVEDEATDDEVVLADHEGDEVSQDSHGLTAEQIQALHKKIDSNTDGKITMEEAKQFVHNMQLADGLKYTAEQVKEIPVASSGKYTSKEILHIHGGDSNLPEEDGDNEKMEEPHFDTQELHHITFKVADQNGDGFLDEKELPVYYFPENYDNALTVVAGYQLKQLDTNNDSQLSKVELAHSDDPAIIEDIEPEFKMLDKDADGFLSVDEFKPYHSGYHWTEKDLKSLFDTADVNGDKHITASELQERHPALEDPTFWFLGTWADHHEL